MYSEYTNPYIWTISRAKPELDQNGQNTQAGKISQAGQEQRQFTQAGIVSQAGDLPRKKTQAGSTSQAAQEQNRQRTQAGKTQSDPSPNKTNKGKWSEFRQLENQKGPGDDLRVTIKLQQTMDLNKKLHEENIDLLTKLVKIRDDHEKAQKKITSNNKEVKEMKKLNKDLKEQVEEKENEIKALRSKISNRNKETPEESQLKEENQDLKRQIEAFKNRLWETQIITRKPVQDKLLVIMDSNREFILSMINFKNKIDYTDNIFTAKMLLQLLKNRNDVLVKKITEATHLVLMEGLNDIKIGEKAEKVYEQLREATKLIKNINPSINVYITQECQFQYKEDKEKNTQVKILNMLICEGVDPKIYNYIPQPPSGIDSVYDGYHITREHAKKVADKINRVINKQHDSRPILEYEAYTPEKSMERPRNTTHRSNQGKSYSDVDICRFFLKGFCRQGRACRFTHSKAPATQSRGRSPKRKMTNDRRNPEEQHENRQRQQRGQPTNSRQHLHEERKRERRDEELPSRTQSPKPQSRSLSRSFGGARPKTPRRNSSKESQEYTFTQDVRYVEQDKDECNNCSHTKERWYNDDNDA